MTRKEQKEAYKHLIASVSAILYHLDPASLNFGFNPEEYEPEAETIVARLDSCKSEEDVLDLVEHELEEWFDEETADAPQVADIATEIWKLIDPENTQNGSS